MKEKTATFIGHNICYGLTPEKIETAIHSLIEKGITIFLSNGAGCFDRTCAEIVYKLKEEYPYIKNNIVIPRPTFRIFNGNIFDEIICSDIKVYRYLVDSSAYAICFINHNWGEAVKTFKYAQKTSITIINIAY